MNKILLSSIQRLLIFASLVCNISIALGQGEGISSPPHYPIIPQTGNVLIDEKAHNEAKKQWIENYPEEYRQAGGDPNIILPQNTITEIPQSHEVPAALPPFMAQKSYRLIRYEAVAAKNKAVSAAEMEKEIASLKNDFLGAKTELQIGTDNQIRLFELDKLDIRAVEKRNQNKVEWFFENKECESCSKTLYLEIEKESDSAISYLMQSEDENAIFLYRLVFEVITKP